MSDGEVLHADHVLDYPYSRSVGPIIGAFLTGLRDGKILGATGAGGSVIVDSQLGKGSVFTLVFPAA